MMLVGNRQYQLSERAGKVYPNGCYAFVEITQMICRSTVQRLLKGIFRIGREVYYLFIGSILWPMFQTSPMRSRAEISFLLAFNMRYLCENHEDASKALPSSRRITGWPYRLAGWLVAIVALTRCSNLFLSKRSV